MPTSAGSLKPLRFWWSVSTGAAGTLGAIVYLLGAADRIPLAMLGPSLAFVFPGYIMRGLLSPGELGWQDWRDILLMGLGSGLFWGALAAAVIAAWRLVLRLRTRGSAA